MPDESRDRSQEPVVNRMFLTAHATEQAQKRGITRQSISLVVQYGHGERDRLGRFRKTIRKKEAKFLRERKGVPPSVIEKAVGTTVITRETDQIVTVITVLPRNARRRVKGKRIAREGYKRAGLWYFN